MRSINGLRNYRRKRASLVRLVSAVPTILALTATILFVPVAARAAVDLPNIEPVVECAALLDQDFTTVDGAPSRLDSAEVVPVEGHGDQCIVKGYVAPDVRFEVRLPVAGWTQRFLMLGCGGYCGAVNADHQINQVRQTSGCAPLHSGEFVTASTDLGHARSASFFPDGLWARNNPGAVVDFAYAGMHKSTLVSKAVIQAYYGQPAEYHYYVGCSDGGRQGLQEAQRFPDDYDAFVIGAPTIDVVTTNTLYHAWGVRTNTGEDGGPILTADKIPALAAAVAEECGDAGGLIQDPRACAFDPASMICTGADTADCLTRQQADVVRKLWDGPVDETGAHLTPRNMPKGSELAWIKTMVPELGVSEMSHRTLGDAQWSFDFPNYMASFEGPTGITYANMEFNRESFDRLHELSGLYDPTNPDLGSFARSGGKMILWTGWADPGVSPYIALNYYDTVRETMGEGAVADFLTFYTLPGVYHCGGGPQQARMDFLTPLMDWVEDGTAPDKVVVNFEQDEVATMTRPAYPFPSQVEYDGTGDIKSEASWRKVDLPEGLPGRFEWVGLQNYAPGNAMWCERDGAAFACETR